MGTSTNSLSLSRYAQLSKVRDPLIELIRVVNWALFRSALSTIADKTHKNTVGRELIDQLLLFKMLVLQRLYYLADVAQKKHKPTEKLIDRFDECLRAVKVELKSGQIVDAAFVTAPIQRNKRKENALIREVAIPIERCKEPHKLAQQDTDAHFTKSNGESINGHKEHFNLDRDIQMIKAWKGTPAQGYDSKALEAVFLSPEIGGSEILPDSAYGNAERKIKKLSLAAFKFLNIKSNWYAITTLAIHKLVVEKIVYISMRLAPFLTYVSWYTVCIPTSKKTNSLNKILCSLAT